MSILFRVILFVAILVFDQNASASTVKTPEGRSVSDLHDFGEASSSQITTMNTYTDNWIRDHELNAVRIAPSSATYNCHYYAWVKSEQGGSDWMDWPELYEFIDDEEYSNDDLPSYIDATELTASHSHYTTKDHSVRKIQNSYPTASIGGRDYVAKWGNWGLVQHQKNHDPYHDKDNLGHDFRKLKTTHSGTLSSYDKTWIGNGGITHNITSDVTVASGKNITIQGDVTLTRSSTSVDLKFSPGSGSIIVEDESTFSVTGSAGNLFKMISSDATPARDDWSGIVVEAGGNLGLNYCEISDAEIGVEAEGADEVIITNSEIHHNEEHGISMQLYSGDVVDITGNKIHDNVWMGILSISSLGSVNIAYNQIYDNTIGGVYVQNIYTTILNNTITGNGYGIGGNCLDTGDYYFKVINNIVCDNNLGSLNNWGIRQYSGSRNFSISYNNVYDHDGLEYYGCSAGTGDIALNPDFQSAGTNDYRLDYDSPCIDEGDPDSQYDDPDDSNSDMGALYYYVLPPGTPTYIWGRNNPILSWSASPSSDIDEYEVWKKKNLGSWSLYATTSLLTYTDLNEFRWFSPNSKDKAYYKILAVDLGGRKSDYSGERVITVNGSVSKPIAPNNEIVVEEYYLRNNYPNPFNPSTSLSFGLPEMSRVNLQVYNVRGELVHDLTDAGMSSGTHTIVFNGADYAGGIYFYKIMCTSLETGSTFSEVKRMLLVK